MGWAPLGRVCLSPSASPSQTPTHRSDDGPTPGLQGDVYIHSSHKMHPLMDTPNSERCMQPETQDGLDELGLGPWEDPRRDQTLTLLRLFPEVEEAGQVVSQARRASCQEMAQPGPGLGSIAPDPSWGPPAGSAPAPILASALAVPPA